MNSYNVEDTKVQVHNKEIGGFIEGDFISVSNESIILRLSVFSESVPSLISLVGQSTNVKVESGLFKGDDRLTYLDEDGEFLLASYHMKYNSITIPSINFVFTKMQGI